MQSLRGAASIVGVAEAGIGIHPELTALGIQGMAASAALAQAGISPSDVDAVFSSKGSDLQPGERPMAEVAEYLGIRPRYGDSVLAGGCGPVMQIQHAVAAIALGLCEVALVTYASTQASRRTRSIAGVKRDPESVTMQFDRPTGLPMPIGPAALAAQRHMHLYGTRPEDLAAVAISCREWARRNPSAMKREPLTLQEVMDSPLIADPLRRHDICLVSDGGGAVVITSTERASALGRPSAQILGFAEQHAHATIGQVRDLTTTMAVQTGQRAFAMAGLTPQDIQLVQIYDAFTIMPIVLLEDLGFCAKGEGGRFVSSGATSAGGRLPMNTQGGGLSHCHPGMYGIFLVIEAARQLMGTGGERQVSGAERALCHASGGGAFGGAHATLILGRG